MSGAQKEPAAPAAGGTDPSMEDILASIRRILSEDETPGKPAEPAPVEAPADAASDVLTLDDSMLVESEKPAEPQAPEPVEPEEAVAPEPVMPEPPAVVSEPEPEPEPASAPPAPISQEEAPTSTLVAPETAAAAAGSVSSLLRTLADRQSVAISRNGPTLEDLVREEMRPLLKEWLDQNLPPMVERLVRAEIERVVARAVT